jgi:hypothetical protein
MPPSYSPVLQIAEPVLNEISSTVGFEAELERVRCIGEVLFIRRIRFSFLDSFEPLTPKTASNTLLDNYSGCGCLQPHLFGRKVIVEALLLAK